MTPSILGHPLRLLSLLCVCQTGLLLVPRSAQADGEVICNRVRIFPMKGHEKDVVGAKIAVSNVSNRAGFQPVAEVKAQPNPGEWVEVTFDNRKPYRYVRYEAPDGSHSRLSELEFYAGQQKLSGAGFGSIGGGQVWKKAFDRDLNNFVETEIADGQYIGLDFEDRATGKRPAMDPPPGRYPGEVKVVLKSATPGTTIRYTMDGTMPGPENGQVYTTPILIRGRTALQAVTLKEGLAPSPVSIGVYLVGNAPAAEVYTLHLGNSLTRSSHRFPMYAELAGHDHQYKSFLHGGATTKMVWDDATGPRRQEWEELFASLPKIDHVTVQPRDFNLESEARSDVQFFNLARQKTPGVQPWLYAEWVEWSRKRPTDNGTLPSFQLTKVWPAMTWEESMSAMLLYVEDVRQKISEIDKEHPAPRVLPTNLAMGWIHHLIDSGKFPGMAPGSFYLNLFEDTVHPNPEGEYLLDLTWLAAFYGRPPVVPPAGTSLTLEQAAAMQRLAWDVVKNYPGAGLYEEGATPVGAPRVSRAPGPISDLTAVSLQSSTAGAWFRYTLDGTTPTRTRGYVYCGVISVRPGMTLKAIGYKSGMADSPVMEAAYPAGKK